MRVIGKPLEPGNIVVSDRGSDTFYNCIVDSREVVFFNAIPPRILS
jgi:hypothetical protein